MNYEESVRALMALGRELGRAAAGARSRNSASRTSQRSPKRSRQSAARRALRAHRRHKRQRLDGRDARIHSARRRTAHRALHFAASRADQRAHPHRRRRYLRRGFRGRLDARARCDRIAHGSGQTRRASTFFECVTAMAFLAFAAAATWISRSTKSGMGGRLDATNIVAAGSGRHHAHRFRPREFSRPLHRGNRRRKSRNHQARRVGGERGGAARSARGDRAALRRNSMRGSWKWTPPGASKTTQSSGGCYRARGLAARFAPEDCARAAAPRPLPDSQRAHRRDGRAAAGRARISGHRSRRSRAASRRVRWPGRLERLSDGPAVYLDGTHNPAGARELLRFWEENFAGRALLLVYGAMRDKAVDEIAGLLFPRAETVILTEPRQPRAISAPLLAEITGHLAKQVHHRSRPRRGARTRNRMATPGRRRFCHRLALPCGRTARLLARSKVGRSTRGPSAPHGHSDET